MHSQGPPQLERATVIERRYASMYERRRIHFFAIALGVLTSRPFRCCTLSSRHRISARACRLGTIPGSGSIKFSVSSPAGLHQPYTRAARLMLCVDKHKGGSRFNSIDMGAQPTSAATVRDLVAASGTAFSSRFHVSARDLLFKTLVRTSKPNRTI